MSLFTYTGKLYGKIGRRYTPLSMTSEEVDQLQAKHDALLIALKNLHDAVTNRMAPDNPTNIERLALYTAHKEASNLLKAKP